MLICHLFVVGSLLDDGNVGDGIERGDYDNVFTTA